LYFQSRLAGTCKPNLCFTKTCHAVQVHPTHWGKNSGRCFKLQFVDLGFKLSLSRVALRFGVLDFLAQCRELRLPDCRVVLCSAAAALFLRRCRATL
jgi:hypothetical protein